MGTVRKTRDYEELRCFSCGYQGKDYYVGIETVMCPECRSYDFRIVSSADCVNYEPGDVLERLETGAVLKCWVCGYCGETYVEDANTEIRCPICRSLTVKINRNTGTAFELLLAKAIISELIESIKNHEEVERVVDKAQKFVDGYLTSSTNN